MENLIDILYERGFIEQTTHDEKLRDYFQNERVTCYIGFDPTASSLHIGSLVPIMSLSHMQRHGHRPIALVGGGTGLVGDPSGKTEMRKMLTPVRIDENAIGIKKQLSNFLDFSNDKAMMLNNADWLTPLGYISFLRDIGRHFSVNRMIKTESYRMRLDSDEGLNFIEFNYMLLQAYDFLHLFQNQDCHLQMGGSDQWGNIVAGIELIRRVQHDMAFGITFPLITTSSGAKMGKTAKGAVWLDPNKTSPYEYYQYWINTDDRDVVKFLALFTFLPMDEIKRVGLLSDNELNDAKAILAFEATVLAHGKNEGIKAYHSACEMFGDKKISTSILPTSIIHGQTLEEGGDSVPKSYLAKNDLETGISAFKLFHQVGLAKSRSDARRLIEQGGGYLNGRRIETFDASITITDFNNKEILLRAGKKRFHRIFIKS